MFKNRALQVKMVPIDGSDTPPSIASIQNTVELEKLDAFIKSQVDYAAVGIIKTYTAITIVKTLSKIAINIAPKAR